LSNNQTVPQSVYPATGDVASTVGDSNLTVDGIQGVPVLDQAPSDGQILIYDTGAPNGPAYVPGDPVVSGTDAPGNQSTANPVQVAGIDDGNLVRELRTDTYGSLRALNLEELLMEVILELRAIKAAVVSDKFVNDLELMADNFQDFKVGA
jgi:hypothetical protein